MRSTPPPSAPPRPLGRREFLAGLATVAVAGACGQRSPHVVDRAAVRRRLTLAAVVDRLLPGDGLPGALEAGADGFVVAQLARPELAVFRREVDAGLADLDRAARARGASDFAGLPVAERAALLAQVAADRRGSPRWFQALLTLTIEGTLADPAHGANRGGTGWRMAGYEPLPPRCHGSG